MEENDFSLYIERSCECFLKKAKQKINIFWRFQGHFLFEYSFKMDNKYGSHNNLVICQEMMGRAS